MMYLVAARVNEFLSNCSQMKIIVTNTNILSCSHINTEAITVYIQYFLHHDYPYLDEMAKIIRHQWQHKDVLSMMKEWKGKDTSPASFKITSTLSSRVVFKKRE